jgi:Kef-type K+ transport system membrane component KefB/mannitol/fructose-specific phosphotransferase system IIA component (Ntr-type)
LLDSIPIAERIPPLLIVAMIVLMGAAGGWVAHQCRLPSIIGNLAAGVLIGPSALGLIHEKQTIDSLLPLSQFAMGLIMVSTGAHLSWRRIHNAWQRIALIAIFEVTLAVVLTTVGLWLLFDLPWPMALLIGAMSGDTAPATLIHISREARAKGPFIKTLLSVVALDNILAITIFVVLLTLVAGDFGLDPATANGPPDWFLPVWILLGSLVLGIVLGRATEFLVHRPHFHNFTTVFIVIMLGVGLAGWLGMSPLLTGLFLGFYLSNASRDAEMQLSTLEPIEWMLYVAFFTLAGVTLHLDTLPAIGLMGVGFVLLRITGKVAGSVLGGLLSGSSRRIWQNIPLGMVPQAGVAIALVVLLQSDRRIPEEVRHQVGTLVLAAVVINELIGPLTTRFALKRAGEINKGRARLVEFLQEEYIKTHLKPADKWDAIRQLCEFAVRVHRLESTTADQLFESVRERESLDTTAIGKGAAIPHGTVEHGPEILGVLGICNEGVDFDAPDGQKVHLIMLIVTPKEHRQQHLKVMAALTAIISHPIVRTRLLVAEDANQAWEIIESEETPGYNYFLEE